jgi:hypothetical protein
MMTCIPRRTALFAALLLAAPAAAWAQVGPMDPSTMMRQHANDNPIENKPAEVLPPALPGAASRSGNAAPTTQIPSDMSPNDALFDAINRGDIAAARDALNRGADLNGRNLLGMTPMELSVDLARNDISFLLLSMRGSGDSSGGKVAAQSAAPAVVPAKATDKAATSRSAGRAAAAAPPKATAAVAPPPVPQAPRLFANDGGTPVPNAGFLGFDATRSMH